MSKVRSELPSVVIVQLLTHICLFETPCTAACQAFLSFTISWNFLKFMSFELVMLSNHLILHFPLLLFLSVFPSNRVFSNESALRIKCFSFSISPSVEYSGWPGLVSLQTKGLSRVFSSTTILKHQFFCLAFFTIHLSHPYMCVLVIQSCPTLCNFMDCIPPGSSVHVILQARILEWGAIPFSRGSSWPPGSRSNLDLLNCRQILYHLSHQGRTWLLELWLI